MLDYAAPLFNAVDRLFDHQLRDAQREYGSSAEKSEREAQRAWELQVRTEPIKACIRALGPNASEREYAEIVGYLMQAIKRSNFSHLSGADAIDPLDDARVILLDAADRSEGYCLRFPSWSKESRA